MTPIFQTKWLALSEEIYGTLLVLYPAEYRHEYGPLMLQVFRDVSRDAYQRQGMLGMIFWWCRTLFDLTVTVIEERRRVRFVMTKSTLIHSAGMLLAVGGAFTALAAFSQFQPGDHYTYEGIYQALLWLMAPGMLLVGLGCFGLALRYSQPLGVLGRWLLYGTGVGSLAMSAALVVSTIQPSLWNVWVLGFLIYTGGLIAFGLWHARTPVLPVFRFLPLQMGAGWAVLILWMVPSSNEILIHALQFLMFVGMGLAWMAIGMAVNRQRRSDDLVAQAG